MEFFPILLSLLCISSPVFSNPTITLSLSPFHSHSPPHSNHINSLTSSSLTRSHHLKTRTDTDTDIASNDVITKPDLSPHSYGGYSISLSFGTPPQSLSFVFDTGSSLVWFPCTSHYLCSACSFPNLDSSQIPNFIPKLSSSSKIVGCSNPKCEWIFSANVTHKCQNCNLISTNCTGSCPGYVVQYGSGVTVGFLLFETLDFTEISVTEFLVGCSVFSIHQPAGIAGFGRGNESLPSQLGLKRFSYCLVSRRFDDLPVSSPLVLEFGEESGDSKTDGLVYAPFRENPSGSNPAFREYYYVSLRKILVGGKSVKIPYKFLVQDSAGNGGVIIDSGSTFTFLDKPIFDAVEEEFEKQLIEYHRDTDVEALTG